MSPGIPTALKMEHQHCEATTDEETNTAKTGTVILLGRSQVNKTPGMNDPWNRNPATRGPPLMQTLRVERDEMSARAVTAVKAEGAQN